MDSIFVIFMFLNAALLERAVEGRPARVGVIGAGKFGSMFLAQARTARGWPSRRQLITVDGAAGTVLLGVSGSDDGVAPQDRNGAHCRVAAPFEGGRR
ncbi:MAG: hypothetical protein GEV03_06970 [Streptosporangiales bacterium]|nr:hypothetical protein [Streptosporangiales bacterium]